jgi:predicted GNAT family N-acyltransferase
MYQYFFKPWSEASPIAYPIRYQVFVLEQRIPIDLEIDEHDASAQHLIVLLNQKPIGTARIFKANHQSNDHLKIGRLAILKDHRRQGLGSKMMEMLINYAEIHQYKKISLHAQIDALGFYENFGFIADSEEFIEGGILHRECVKFPTKIT